MHIIDKQSVSPWYWGYLFQGAVVLGLAPLLLPILAGIHMGPAQVGLVVAAFYLGQLPAPLIGVLADKTKRLDLFYLGGYVLLALGAGLFPFTHTFWIWLVLAFIQGLGAAGSNTVAAMYIVEYHPHDQWDRRIGWLQTLYGTGQALGLLLTALVQSEPSIGLWICAALMLPGFLLGRRGLPQTTARKPHPEEATPTAHHHPPVRSALGFLHYYHRPSLAAVKKCLRAWESPFGLLQISWFLILFGMWSIMNLYPLLMQEAYGIDAGLSSLYYGIAATVGIFFYAPSGIWGKRYGDAPILLIGILMLVITALGMAALSQWVPSSVAYYLAPVAFFFLPVAWSPLIVAGTGLTGQLATVDEGEAMGLFNANTALSSVLASVAAGWVAATWSYGAVPILAAISIVTGTVLFLPLLWWKK